MPALTYATYSDLEASLDSTILAQLCGDTGTPMPGSNPITTHALERATAIVRAYTRVGENYNEAELAILAAAQDPLLVMLTCDLAIEILFQRRGAKITPAVEQRLKQAYSMLEALRDGKMIFGSVNSNAAAGLPMVAVVPLANLGWYNQASNQSFFPPRKPNIYPS